MSEKIIHQQVCEYINMQYPNVIFTSDPSGMRVSVGLRKELKRKRCNNYKIPDLLILHPINGKSGLMLEIKKNGVKLHKKDGSFKDEHTELQAASIDRLRVIGYAAEFGIGFDNCKKIIDNYFKLQP
jgi:hypothetical protein